MSQDPFDTSSTLPHQKFAYNSSTFATHRTDVPAEAEARCFIGIYGIPGAGKSFLLNQIKQKLGDELLFFEGSDLIRSVLSVGIEALPGLEQSHKERVRGDAIRKAATDGEVQKKSVVVVGHYMFWDENQANGEVAMTKDDLQTYTHILYLDTPPQIVMQRRQNDKFRDRQSSSIAHLDKWQKTEKADLRRLCYQHNILFTVLSDHSELIEHVPRLVRHLQSYTPPQNYLAYCAEFDKVMAIGNQQWETLLVMDADKTLTAIDTGKLFWEKVDEMWPSRVLHDPLKEIFSSEMHYNYTAFLQATLVYEEFLADDEFETVCKAVADATTMYPEFVSLLQIVSGLEKTGAVIVTSGIARVWELILKYYGLANKIKVIGGGRFANGYVVTPNTKTDLVRRARGRYRAYVYAFGDSPLDLGMLTESGQAIVVVGEEQSRSKSMKKALQDAIEGQSNFRQVLLPSTVKPRLTLDQLPLVHLTDFEYISNMLRAEQDRPHLEYLHATDSNAAKLLMTPMRDARLSGPALREAHRLTGHFLATAYLSQLTGLEEHPIPHVQGHATTGHRFLHEHKTLIIPLMRGGEPMALGINDALPHASFLHAKHPHDLTQHHLQGQLTVILVDSVVNSGASLLEFVQHIREIHGSVRIVAVVGVVQQKALSRLEQEACCRLNFHLIALRESDNKFTGKGTTDTGNRLFNTTHLD